VEAGTQRRSSVVRGGERRGRLKKVPGPGRGGKNANTKSTLLGDKKHIRRYATGVLCLRRIFGLP